MPARENSAIGFPGLDPGRERRLYVCFMRRASSVREWIPSFA